MKIQHMLSHVALSTHQHHHVFSPQPPCSTTTTTTIIKTKIRIITWARWSTQLAAALQAFSTTSSQPAMTLADGKSLKGATGHAEQIIVN
jgi:hypothetical protein